MLQHSIEQYLLNVAIPSSYRTLVTVVILHGLVYEHTSFNISSVYIAVSKLCLCMFSILVHFTIILCQTVII